MIDVSIIGTVREVVWKNDKCCKFIIQNDDGQILGTITRLNMDLSEKACNVGQEYKFIGVIKVYKRIKETVDKCIRDNVFYINNIEDV